MKRLFAIFILILSSTFATCQIINIPNDYPTIQQGIIAAADGDTVLVDTGIYNENIDFNGKNITVASHYLISLDTFYISQTIIDGNLEGCVVVFRNFETAQAKLIGFTITNGYNDESWPYGCGGGILTSEASPTLMFLRVKNNFSEEGGGGIACLGGTPNLINITISYNMSSSVGGGIFTSGAEAQLENMLISFNTAESGGGCYFSYADLSLDNVIISHNYGDGLRFYNSSSYLKGVVIKHNLGGLICRGYYPNPIPTFDTVKKCCIYSNSSYLHKDIISYFKMHIVLDTFSVLYPSDYYIFNIDSLSFEIECGLIDQIDSDVYVSANGSDSNDGLSEETPLKTLHFAFSKLRADSLHHHKVLLMEGNYGPSFNEEYMPIKLPAFINIEGYDMENVVLNAEGLSRVLHLVDNSSINYVSNFTVKGGASDYNGGGININRSGARLENLNIKENEAGDMGGGISIWSSTVEMKNLKIINNYAEGLGGGLWCYHSTVSLTDLLVANNESNNNGGGVSISLSDAQIINSTICSNQTKEDTTSGGGIFLGGFHSYNNNVWLTNSIVWDNSSNQIAMENNHSWNPINNDKLYCLNSNVEGGELGIVTHLYDTIYWLEGNIDKGPLFFGSGINPYQINNGSPCIDAGTLDTSGLYLPENDLAGEIRIFNDRVDMGAYEWNPYVGIDDDLISESNCIGLIEIYPNPSSTHITIELKNVVGAYSLSVYNQSGHHLITQSISEPQTEIDISHLPVGIYIVKVWNDKEVMVRKLIKQ